MNRVMSKLESHPFQVDGGCARFRITIAFFLVSILAMIGASFAVERVAQRIGEDAAVRAGTEIASQQAGLIGALFSSAIANVGESGGSGSSPDAFPVDAENDSAQIDPTAAAILFVDATDIDTLLMSNDIRHLAMLDAGGEHIWEAGDKMVGRSGFEMEPEDAAEGTVSSLSRGLVLAPHVSAGDPITVDAVESLVPLNLGGGEGTDLLLHVVLDVTETLDAGIAETKSAIGIAILTVLGSLLAAMSALVLLGEIRMARKNDVLVARERLVASQLDDENRELQRIDQAKNEFLSNVSHELKTPLAAVLGFTRIIKGNKRKNLDESDLRVLTTIERNGWRLNTLIDDLLDLSRIESKKIRLQKESVNLNSVIEEVSRSFETILSDRDQTLSLDVQERDAWIEGDRGRLIQVMSNILSNAAKYSDPGTQIALRSVIRGDTAILSVTDQGRGMKPEDLAQLFSLFFRAPDAERSSTPGTGIGLYISRKIVELHDGEISVESTYGVGTTVTVQLPGITERAKTEQPDRPKFVNRLNELPGLENAGTPG